MANSSFASAAWMSESDLGVPRPTRLDLHGSLLGALFRVHPLFWVSVGALGWGYYALPDGGSSTLWLLWVCCTLVSFLAHEGGHILLGRLLGIQLHVVSYLLGSLTLGVDSLPYRFQRILVRLGGVGGNAVLCGLCWLITAVPLPEFVQSRPEFLGLTVNAVYMLFLFNACWALLNLLPIWPLDGGIIWRDLCVGILGPRGHAIALGACLFFSGLLGLGIGQRVQTDMALVMDPRGSVRLQVDVVLLIFSVLFIASGLRALRLEYRRYQNRPA
jgi:Zn-dependent protease